MKRILLLILWIGGGNYVFSQPELLQSGPMVGHVQPDKVTFWVQTKKEAIVKIKYYEQRSPEISFYTSEYKTSSTEGYTAHLLGDKTSPGKNYFYELYINNVLVPRPYSLRFKTSGASVVPASFKVAMGSCAYVNDSSSKSESYKGGNYEIYTAIYSKDPDMMLWLGDNAYLRNKDWTSKEGMLYRYTHTRSLPVLQPLLGATENYAVWDDHDYGPNDSDKNFSNKKISLQVFKNFWANPSYGFGETEAAVTTFVKEDVQFFLLDDRSFRDPGEDSDDRNEILGKKQLEWLIKGLKESKATFKIVAMGGQVLNPLRVYENYSKYEKEWDKLLTALQDPSIRGVVFLSGDRHFSEAMKMDRKSLSPLYEFTVSPLNSRPYQEVDEKNPIRMPGSLIKENNFAVLEFTGEVAERAMKMVYYDKDGKMLFEKVIKAIELK
jgi:alkaline phosphatase D